MAGLGPYGNPALGQMVTDLESLLGMPHSDAVPPQLAQALTVVTNIARAYTRGTGFDYEGNPAHDDIASVIVLAAARLMANPSQLPIREQMGSIVVDKRGGWVGWSVGELAVLDRYRCTAM